MQKLRAKLKDLWEKVKSFFKKLNKKTLTVLGVCAVVILALIIAAAVLLNRKEYALLYTGLNSSETTTVTKYLSEQGISDYQIRGDAIYVPKGRELQLQVELAQGGYLTTGFNYDYYTEHINSFSTNAERVEATRIATVQKLEAAIRLMDGVRSAVVDITPGTDRIYMLQDDVSEGTAWVTVETEGSQPLSDGVVEAIRNMVSHSDKSLNIGSVTIQDLHGNVYNDTDTMGSMNDANALRLQCEQQINNQVRSGVLQLLEDIYGEGNVNVTVNTTVDVSRQVVESTAYQQPEGAVEGGGLIGEEKWWWEIGTDEDVPAGGTVGTATNSDIPNYPNITPNANGSPNYSIGQGERDHEIDTTVTQTERLAGRIEDVNVAMTINQNSPNSGALSIEQLSSQVAVASGIGTAVEGWESHVSVLIAPFAVDTPAPSDLTGIMAILAALPDWAIYAAIAGLVLFFILLIVILLLVRRSKKKKQAKLQALEEEQRAAEEAAAAAAAAEILAAAPPTTGADIMEVNTEKSMELRKNVRLFAQNNPEIAAQMVKAWLKGDEVSG